MNQKEIKPDSPIKFLSFCSWQFVGERRKNEKIQITALLNQVKTPKFEIKPINGGLPVRVKISLVNLEAETLFCNPEMIKMNRKGM